MGAARGGGAKGFFRQVGTGIATPFVATYKKINPQLASKGNETNKGHTKWYGDIKQEFLNKKLGKVSSKIPKNALGVSFDKPQNRKEIKINKNISKLSNKMPKLQDKQRKLNDMLKKHSNKSDTRQAKWDEKSAKKQEKKKS